MAIIEVEHVVKKYRLGQSHNLRRSLQRLLRPAATGDQPKTHFNALNDVNFSVEEGEVLGIIGTNGAGKSTLLKVLSGITTPTTGRMTARGRIAPLIEVGAGLIADLTGRENIFLNGVILGMSVREIRRKLDDIIAFSELEAFIDTPIKRYSSGMAVRLGFSIATSVDADILIVDEVLAVGDVAFQRKCFDRMEDMIKRQGKTVLLVSHNVRQVERLCTRVLLLDHGQVVMDGAPGPTCELFYQRSDEKIQVNVKKQHSTRWGNTQVSDEVTVSTIELLDHESRAGEAITYKKDFFVRLRFSVNHEIEEPVIGFGIHTPDLLYVTTHNSDHQVTIERLGVGAFEATCRVQQCPLLPGVYAIRIGITEGSTMRTLFYGENLVHFQVMPNPDHVIVNANRSGFFEMNARWECQSSPQAPETATTAAIDDRVDATLADAAH